MAKVQNVEKWGRNTAKERYMQYGGTTTTTLQQRNPRVTDVPTRTVDPSQDIPASGVLPPLERARLPSDVPTRPSLKELGQKRGGRR